jgi:DNA-binding LytR/AlgR family response regulator
MKKKKILVVEDSESDQEIIRIIFQEEWKEVDLVFSKSCLQSISEFGLISYDFVLVDFRLGIIDASSLISLLSESGMLFAVFTGLDEYEIREESKEDFPYINKRDIQNLPKIIKELMRTSQD